jgi:hypothetical protein
MTILDFRNEIAAVEFASVRRRYDDIPKELKVEDLPAQWTEMPAATVGPAELFSTFEEGGSRYIVSLFIAVARVMEGFPAEQVQATLEAAEEVEAWAKTTPYLVEITTSARVPVGSVEYRGVGARITADAAE